MKIGQRHIDHIVYSVPNLEDACDSLESALGVKPVFGGYHKTQGTKNALLNLGHDCYLEILAIDESNDAIQKGRWMGVDLIHEGRITRWAIKSEDLRHDQGLLKTYNVEMGEIYGGSRQTPQGDLLEWEMILPLANPQIEMAPFMVKWSDTSVHPTQDLSGICPLIGIEFLHKNVDPQELFDKLGLDQQIQPSPETEIKIKLKSCSGEIITLN